MNFYKAGFQFRQSFKAAYNWRFALPALKMFAVGKKGTFSGT